LVLDPPFRLTVNTEGASPALSAAVANELRAQYRGYGALAGLLGRLRPLVLGADLARERRRDIFRALAEDKSLPALMAEGRYGEVRGLVEGHLAPVRLPGDFSIP
ncbi:MAG: hypothetical protein LBL95_06220, partial [Deltaproteobacteria bacterium]|nr:hypothetical protein [Deltaproteobacteria bacterium]